MEQTREEELSTQMGTQLRRRRRYVKGRSRRKKRGWEFGLSLKKPLGREECAHLYLAFSLQALNDPHPLRFNHQPRASSHLQSFPL